MQETITLKITMNDLKTILLNHYKEALNDENIKLIYEVIEVDFYNEVNISIIKQTKVGNFSGEIEYKLTTKEVLEVLNVELEKSGYQTKKINYHVMNETVKEIEFNVEKTNNKQKSIGGIK